MSPDPKRDCEHGRKKGKCIDCDFVEVETENDQLRATIATLTAERDALDARAEQFGRGLANCRGNCAELKRRAEAAEAALSVAAASNGALREAIRVMVFKLERQTLAVASITDLPYVGFALADARTALAAPPVADPRTEALASALAEIERWEQPGASWARELARAALAAWRAR